MILGRVVGTVVATRKDERLTGREAPARAHHRSPGQGRSRLLGRGRHGRRGPERPRAGRHRLLGAHGLGPQGLPGGRRHRRRRGQRGHQPDEPRPRHRHAWSRRARTRRSPASACSSCSRCGPTARRTGKPLVALDSVGAGPGEEVFYVRGREAAFPFLPQEPPADAAIVGIVDSLAHGAGMMHRPRGRQRGRDPEERQARRCEAHAGPAARPRRRTEGCAPCWPSTAWTRASATACSLIQDGRSAQLVLGKGPAAVDAAIIGVVDAVDLG